MNGPQWQATQRVALAATLLVLGGCVPSKVTINTWPKIDEYRVKTVAVIPFEALTTPQVTSPNVPEIQAPQGAKRSDISFAPPQATEKLDQPTATVPPQAAEKLTQIVYGRLKHWEGVQFLPPDRAAGALKALRPATEGEGLTPEEKARQVALRLSADAALLGRVLVYQERVGSKLGADPAAVGFEVKLVAADGTVLWVGNYYEKQRPMNEDFMGSVQRGFVFVTAEELAEYGAGRVIRSFPFGAPSPRPQQ
ncbi:MAG: hypothetical protein ACREIO_01945 [Nitrospiraceae bacterium]